MNLDIIRDECARVARHICRRANYWTFDGREGPDLMRRLRECTYDSSSTRTRVMLTRDVGMHTSGWMKNPDYERCLHLSLSPAPAMVVGAPPLIEDRNVIEELWVRAFFGEHALLTWREGPKSDVGRLREVAHWRLFCDPSWSPIMPRGEVYSSRHTPADWESWSERHADGRGPVVESTLDPT